MPNSIGLGITLALATYGIITAARFLTSRPIRQNEIPSTLPIMQTLAHLNIYGVCSEDTDTDV